MREFRDQAATTRRTRTILPFVSLLTLAIVDCAFSGNEDAEPDESATAQAVEAVESLPYLSRVPTSDEDAAKRGVTLYDQDRAHEGFNLYNSRPRHEAHLIDMQGDVLHSWSFGENRGGWHHIEMNERGELFAIVKDVELIKLDHASNPIWRVPGRFHHEIAIAENGDVYTLSRGPIQVQHRGSSFPILTDYIVVLSPDGREKKRVSIYDLAGERIPEARFDAVAARLMRDGATPSQLRAGSPFDVFHTNAIDIIDRDVGELFKRGDLVVCLRQLDLIAAVDLERESIYWSWGPGELEWPHNPVVFSNGNLVIFDNGVRRKQSRVIELNPVTRAIEWEFPGQIPEEFFSPTRGGVQELPNGNILITESDKGHALELTRDRQIVWEFFNPDVLDNETRDRGVIYRMKRLDPAFVTGLLQQDH